MKQPIYIFARRYGEFLNWCRRNRVPFGQDPTIIYMMNALTVDAKLSTAKEPLVLLLPLAEANPLWDEFTNLRDELRAMGAKRVSEDWVIQNYGKGGVPRGTVTDPRG